MLQVAWLVLANQNALFHSNYAMLKFVCDFTSRVKCTEPGFKWIQMSFYKFKLSICRYKIWSDSRKVYNEITTWMNCSPKRLRFGDPFSSFRAQKPSAKYKMILNIFLQKLCSKQFVHLLAYYPFVDFAETFFSTFSTLFCLPLSIFRFFLCKQTHHRQLSTNIRMINMVSTLFFTPYLHSVILKGSLFCAKDHVWLSYRMHCFWFDELIVIVKLCSSHSQCH